MITKIRPDTLPQKIKKARQYGGLFSIVGNCAQDLRKKLLMKNFKVPEYTRENDKGNKIYDAPHGFKGAEDRYLLTSSSALTRMAGNNTTQARTRITLASGSISNSAGHLLTVRVI